MKTLLILFLIFASFLKGADTMKTVDSVDLEKFMGKWFVIALVPNICLLYTTPSPRDRLKSRMPTSA